MCAKQPCRSLCHSCRHSVCTVSSPDSYRCSRIYLDIDQYGKYIFVLLTNHIKKNETIRLSPNCVICPERLFFTMSAFFLVLPQVSLFVDCVFHIVMRVCVCLCGVCVSRVYVQACLRDNCVCIWCLCEVGFCMECVFVCLECVCVYVYVVAGGGELLPHICYTTQQEGEGGAEGWRRR